MTTKETNSTATSSTYTYQSRLPRLPVPPLDDTLKKFLDTVQPLLSSTQFAETKEIVKDFKKKDGAKLQKMLKEYDKLTSFGSYVEEFWKNAYLAPDTSVVLNSNPYFLFEDDPDSKSQIQRASSLTFQSLRFAASVKNERMKPDDVKGATLCMEQFRSLFGSCRIPRDRKDVIKTHSDSDHVAVLYRNQFYYFRALWPKKEGEVKVAVDEEDIVEILETIVEDGKKQDWVELTEGAVGALTTLNRDQWALAREQLLNCSIGNTRALDIIDSALFVLVLDDYQPTDIHDAAANMLHGKHIIKETKHNDNNYHRKQQERYHQAGTCCNRWYDKLQLIVCSDGSAGINFEHSAVDGHTALRFASDIFAETVVTFAKSITKSIYTSRGCPLASMIDANVMRAAAVTKDSNSLDTHPKKIEFDVSRTLKDSIFFAETSLGDNIYANDTHILEFNKFGKSFIVQNRLSPDSLVQMSILIAYYRLYGKIVCAYEPVLTKRFFHGRTEAMRSTTAKAAQLCQIWTSATKTNEEKINALRESTQYHSKLVKEASEGKGIDRHLYALQCIAKKNVEKKRSPMPELFESEAWEALNHTVLSTSNCGNPALRLFGFGPVIPDGYGIGYIIKDSKIQYSISSKHRQTKRFAHALSQTLQEICDILKKPLRSQSMECHNNQVTSATTKTLGQRKVHWKMDYFMCGASSISGEAATKESRDEESSYSRKGKIDRKNSWRKAVPNFGETHVRIEI
mmetsp:Transcript_26061/g.38534  ORF Transcript_26061/g.38534 Transcript_26061/m.38534 type:complete len:740 (-) Transcript_26061:64-2283(-)